MVGVLKMLLLKLGLMEQGKVIIFILNKLKIIKIIYLLKLRKYLRPDTLYADERYANIT